MRGDRLIARLAGIALLVMTAATLVSLELLAAPAIPGRMPLLGGGRAASLDALAAATRL